MWVETQQQNLGVSHIMPFDSMAMGVGHGSLDPARTSTKCPSPRPFSLESMGHTLFYSIPFHSIHPGGTHYFNLRNQPSPCWLQHQLWYTVWGV